MALGRWAALPWLLALGSGCAGVDRDEVRCEEAMKRVLDCCPAVTRSPVVCEWRQSSLSPYSWTFPEVDCLVGLSCPEIETRGVCAWAASPTTAVCP